MSYTHEDYEWFKAHNICPSCGKRRPAPNRVECDVCAESHIEYRNNLPDAKKEYRRTERREYQRALRAQRKAAGLCTRCGRPLGKFSTHTQCDFCRAEQRIRDARRYKSKMYDSLGVCLWCGAERAPGKYFCKACLAKKSRIARQNKPSTENHPWRRAR